MDIYIQKGLIDNYVITTIFQKSEQLDLPRPESQQFEVSANFTIIWSLIPKISGAKWKQFCHVRNGVIKTTHLDKLN